MALVAGITSKAKRKQGSSDANILLIKASLRPKFLPLSDTHVYVLPVLVTAKLYWISRSAAD